MASTRVVQNIHVNKPTVSTEMTYRKPSLPIVRCNCSSYLMRISELQHNLLTTCTVPYIICLPETRPTNKDTVNLNLILSLDSKTTTLHETVLLIAYRTNIKVINVRTEVNEKLLSCQTGLYYWRYHYHKLLLLSKYGYI